MGTAALWIARLALAVPVAVHGTTKITRRDMFIAKFDLAPELASLAAFAELAGVFGVVAGGIALTRTMPAPLRTLGLVASWLGVVAIASVQIAAITLVHWPKWFYYLGGMEFNLVLLALGLIVALGSWAHYRQGVIHGTRQR